MKGWNQNSKKKRNRKGNGRDNGEGSKIKLSAGLCLLFELPLEKRIDVLVIDTSKELCMFPLSPLKHAVSTSGVGFASVDSKIYVIGGDIDQESGKFPKEVYFWDFDCNKKQWKKGPPLNDMKPDPVVVNINKKIYALAGISLFWDGTFETIDHAFEVLDPEFGNVWTPLPNPPFLSLYTNSNGVDFRGHTVIGLNIYVLVVQPYDCVTLYSFNVIENEWKIHNGGDSSGTACAGSDDVIFHNLSLGAWYFGADVVDYLLYQTALDYPGKGMKVYAYDLTARKEDEKKLTEEEAETFDDDTSSVYSVTSWKSDSGYCYPDDDNLFTVPIFGLNDVTDTVTPSKWTEGFVVHLRDNVFCLVCLYTSHNGKESTEHVRASVFEVDSIEMSNGMEFMNRYLVAENVTQADWIINPKLGSFSASCKIPNKGRQIHFRRPQFQHDGKPNYYLDNVAGKVVQKGKGNPVREINTQMIKGDKLMSML